MQNTEFFDAPGIGVNDHEVDTVRVADHLAALRHTARQRKYQSAQRIYVFVAIMQLERQTQLAFQFLNGRAGIGVVSAVNRVLGKRRWRLGGR